MVVHTACLWAVIGWFDDDIWPAALPSGLSILIWDSDAPSGSETTLAAADVESTWADMLLKYL